MAFTLVQKSETMRALVADLAYAIEKSKVSCGMILIPCALDRRKLKRLKKKLVEAATVKPPRFHYEEESRVLAILFEGETQGHTHWMGLAVKSYLWAAFFLDKNVMVAHFLEQDFPVAKDVEEAIRQLVAEPNTSANLMIYKNLNKLDKKEGVVLIIDDDESGADFLKIKLESYGYEVHQAYDGVQGVRYCEDISPDVVIMELNLPALDGYQVIRNIQENVDLETQIIVLSEQKLEKDVSACHDLGVSNYLTKPYSPVELESTLHKVLEEAIDEDAVI